MKPDRLPNGTPPLFPTSGGQCMNSLPELIRHSRQPQGPKLPRKNPSHFFRGMRRINTYFYSQIDELCIPVSLLLLTWPPAGITLSSTKVKVVE